MSRTERISSVSSTLYKTFWAAGRAPSGRTTLGGEGREILGVREKFVLLSRKTLVNNKKTNIGLGDAAEKKKKKG